MTFLIDEKGGGGGIYPVNKGLGDREGEFPVSINTTNSGGASIKPRSSDNCYMDVISITTLDKWVEDNDIKRIDFIKADIEGAERDMLKGAANVLKEFAPKLAICTYHYPEDPELLEKIILEINPKYKIVHLRKKLFACVLE